MILRQTTNQDEIKKVLLHPDIYPNISEGIDIVIEEFPTDNVLYIGGYNDSIFAISCFHSFRDGLKFHPNILPKYKRQYARDFVKQCLDMIDCPIYIEIPVERKRLFNFSKKMGFDSVSNNKDLSRHLMRLL